MLQGLASLRARQSEVQTQQMEQQLALAALQVFLSRSMTRILTSLAPTCCACSRTPQSLGDGEEVMLMGSTVAFVVGWRADLMS